VPSVRDAVLAPEEEAGLHQASMAVAKEKRILVVDDEELVAHLLNRILERMGCHVTLTYSGEEALALLRENEYDTIITDLKMPGMSGQELYSRLQAIDARLIERVIFTTGDVITAGTADFIEQSGRPSIPKPFTSAQVAIALKELLEARADGGEEDQVPED
jgi:CheY-like chemotaxis protein